MTLAMGSENWGPQDALLSSGLKAGWFGFWEGQQIGQRGVATGIKDVAVGIKDAVVFGYKMATDTRYRGAVNQSLENAIEPLYEACLNEGATYLDACLAKKLGKKAWNGLVEKAKKCNPLYVSGHEEDFSRCMGQFAAVIASSLLAGGTYKGVPVGVRGLIQETSKEISSTVIKTTLLPAGALAADVVLNQSPINLNRAVAKSAVEGAAKVAETVVKDAAEGTAKDATQESAKDAATEAASTPKYTYKKIFTETEYREMARRDLGKMMNQGDIKATEESYRRRFNEAIEAKEYDTALGPAVKSRVAQSLGDKLLKAGEEVETSKGLTRIDGETADIVYEVRSGRFKWNRPLDKLIEVAESRGKKAVLYLQPDKITVEQMERLKKLHPNLEVRSISPEDVEAVSAPITSAKKAAEKAREKIAGATPQNPAAHSAPETPARAASKSFFPVASKSETADKVYEILHSSESAPAPREAEAASAALDVFGAEAVQFRRRYTFAPEDPRFRAIAEVSNRKPTGRYIPLSYEVDVDVDVALKGGRRCCIIEATNTHVLNAQKVDQLTRYVSSNEQWAFLNAGGKKRVILYAPNFLPSAEQAVHSSISPEILIVHDPMELRDVLKKLKAGEL